MNNSFIDAGYANNQSSMASFIGTGNFNSIQTISVFSTSGGTSLRETKGKLVLMPRQHTALIARKTWTTV